MTFKASDSLAEQIAQYLGDRIIRGELQQLERIQEQKVTQLLNVSRGSVREALLILERRHLVTIQPRRGAVVAALTEHNVRSLYALVVELYAMLACLVAQNWRSEADLQPLLDVQAHLQSCADNADVEAFVAGSLEILPPAFALAGNPYLQQTLEDLLPAISRAYYFAFERLTTEMGQFSNVLSALLAAVTRRDLADVRQVLTDYAAHNRQLVLAALAVREAG